MKIRIVLGWSIVIVLALITVLGNLSTKITDPLDRQLIGDNQYVQNNRDHPGVPVGMIVIESENAGAMIATAHKLVSDLQRVLGKHAVIQSLFSQKDPLTFVWDPESQGYTNFVTQDMLAWSEDDLAKRYGQLRQSERSIGALACSSGASRYCTTVSVVGKDISEMVLGWKVFTTVTQWSLLDAIVHYKRYDVLSIDQVYTEVDGHNVRVDLAGWPFIRLMITIVSEIDIYIIIPMVMVIFSAIMIVRPVLGSWVQTGVVVGMILFLLLFCRALIGLWAYIMTISGWDQLSGLYPLEDVFDIRERVVVIVLGMSFFVRRFLDFNQSAGTYFDRWQGSSRTMIFVALISIASFVSSGVMDLFADEKLRSALQVSVIAAVATFVTLLVTLYVLPVIYYPLRNYVAQVNVEGPFSRCLHDALEKTVSVSISWISHKNAARVAMIILLVPVVFAAIGFLQGALVTKGEPIAYAHGTWAYVHAHMRNDDNVIEIGSTGYEVFVEADLNDPEALCDLEKYSSRIARQKKVFVLVNPFLNYADFVLEDRNDSICSVVTTRYDAGTYWGEVKEETESYLFDSSVILPEREQEHSGVRIYLSGRQLMTEDIANMRDMLITLGDGLEHIRVLNTDKISEFVEVERHYTYKRIIGDAMVSIIVVLLFAFGWFGILDLRQRRCRHVWSSISRSAIVASIMTVPFVFAQAGVFCYMMISGMPYDIGTSAINDVAVSAAADLPAFPIQTFLILLIGGTAMSFMKVMSSCIMREELRRTVIDALVNGSQFLLLAIFASIGAIERFGGLLTLTMALCVFAVFFISLPLLRFVRR